MTNFSNFELTSSNVGIAFVAMFCLLVVSIVALRFFLKKDQKGKHTEKLFLRPNFNRFSSLSFSIGLVLALASTLTLMSWTTYSAYEEPVPTIIEWDDEVEVTPPVIKERKPLPPPPKEPVILDEIIPEDEPEFIDEEIKEEKVLPEKIPTNAVIGDKESDGVKEKKEIPLPPPPPPVDDGDEIFKVVEAMPLFGDCMDLLNKAEREACSARNITMFLSKKIKYPPVARDNGIKGKVIVQFVVMKDGTLDKVTVVRGINSLLDKEAVRVIKQMYSWKPGEQRGKKVNVTYTVPVNFDLRE